MMDRVAYDGVPALADSALALEVLRADPAATIEVGSPERDSLLYVLDGGGSLELGEGATLEAGAAALVLAGESAALRASGDGISAILVTVGPDVDRHAPLGNREVTVKLDRSSSDSATGSRSFQILFGPHNGSTRATLFAGFVPPGRAPWHYHLYDEIVVIPEGPVALHLGGDVQELGPGAAFRLRPREPHIVENASPDRELTVLGFFTPAGSPSAAYLEPGANGEYAAGA